MPTNEPCEHGWTGPWNSRPCGCGAPTRFALTVGRYRPIPAHGTILRTSAEVHEFDHAGERTDRYHFFARSWACACGAPLLEQDLVYDLPNGGIAHVRCTTPAMLAGVAA